MGVIITTLKNCGEAKNVKSFRNVTTDVRCVRGGWGVWRHTDITAVLSEGFTSTVPCSGLGLLFPAPHTSPSITHHGLMAFPARPGCESVYRVIAMTLVSDLGNSKMGFKINKQRNKCQMYGM